MYVVHIVFVLRKHQNLMSLEILNVEHDDEHLLEEASSADIPVDKPSLPLA